MCFNDRINRFIKMAMRDNGRLQVYLMRDNVEMLEVGWDSQLRKNQAHQANYIVEKAPRSSEFVGSGRAPTSTKDGSTVDLCQGTNSIAHFHVVD